VHTFVKVLLAILWAALLFAASAALEQLIKMWLWKSHGICPVCSGRGSSYAHAEDAQIVI